MGKNDTKYYVFRYQDSDGYDVTRTVKADTITAAANWFSDEYPGVPFLVLDVDKAFEEAERRARGATSYRDKIVELIDQQRAKGLKKYGQTLEENTTLTTAQRIEHAQEELVDALQYLEHLKAATADNLTANDFQRAAMRTASGIEQQAGEVIDHVKKVCFQGHELDTKHLAEELGDVAWYLAVCCEAIGMKLEDVLQMNIDKLKARYPEGFDKARSINREEAAK